MIHKLTSNDIMSILTRSQDSITDMSADIIKTKNKLEERLNVVRNSQEFLLQTANQLNSDVL